MRWPRIATFLLLGVSLLAEGACGATVQDFDTSIRAAGMGGATTGVAWGEPGAWGNPASLANVRGLAWLEGTSRLIPEIDPPLRLKSRRFLLGAAGIGISLMGEPVDGVGHTRFEYRSTGTDPFGNPYTLREDDEIDGWGIALSPIQLLDAFRARRSPGAPALARSFDVSAGYHHKHTRLSLGGDVGEQDNHDWGVLAKVGLVAGESDRSTRFEISAGYAELNADESAHFVFPAYGDLGPSMRIRRAGVGLRALLPFGDAAAETRPWAWPGALRNAVGLGVAYDRDERELPTFTVISSSTDRWGFEATFMDILAARVGYVSDRGIDLHRWSGGAGVHFPIGRWATLGYDWASEPTGSGLRNSSRHGVSVWLHSESLWPGRPEAK